MCTRAKVATSEGQGRGRKGVPSGRRREWEWGGVWNHTACVCSRAGPLSREGEGRGRFAGLSRPRHD